MPGIKVSNEYAELIANYRDMPKAVLAAVLVSFLTNFRGCQGSAELTETIMEEWKTLHEAGIVPQKPVKY